MDIIYEHARKSHIFTDLAPRRHINSNAILIGPPGSGKNLAIRAMMSDPRTVGVATTIGDLMSEYVGRGQHNVTDLYDEAARVREEHDKPVIIALDEFDVMFPEKEGSAVSTTKRDMQKAFQAVLDGHTMRDGVFTVGLTNNPENIPAAVLRRFAHVEIIEALRYDERLILMQNLLGGIPTEKDFMKKVDWNRIMEESKFASGDTIGKVADAAYRHFVDLFENRRPGRLQRIHERISDMKDKGLQRLSNAQKLQLFQAGKGKSVVLMANEFEQRALEVLESTEAQSDMRAQEQFYEVIRRKLDDGFMDRKLDNH
jgi:SpoVK/Ycf46/Vps4 family AAA+-type ATPase